MVQDEEKTSVATQQQRRRRRRDMDGVNEATCTDYFTFRPVPIRSTAFSAIRPVRAVSYTNSFECQRANTARHSHKRYGPRRMHVGEKRARARTNTHTLTHRDETHQRDHHADAFRCHPSIAQTEICSPHFVTLAVADTGIVAI